MAGDLIVRPVRGADYEDVSRLLAELGRPAPDGATEGLTRAVFERHVASDRTASLIALRDGSAVGVLVLEFRERLNWTTPEAWVPDLVVTEAEHGRGAGPALFRRAVELARARGCHRITLESGDHRRRAHRFYVREGMTDAGKYFIMDLTRPREAGTP
jgi:GNAT superfamily N-acetyltransferase